MSRAVLQPTVNLPGLEQTTVGIEKFGKKSFDAETATNNYRRRLSLAVPEQRPQFVRERSPSDISSLRMMNQGKEGYTVDFLSETRQKNPRLFKKSQTISGSDMKDTGESSPLLRSGRLESPSPSQMRNSAGLKFDAIEEQEDEEVSSPEKSPEKSNATIPIKHQTSTASDQIDAIVDTHPQPFSVYAKDDRLADDDNVKQRMSPKSRLSKKRSLLQKAHSVDTTKLELDETKEDRSPVAMSSSSSSLSDVSPSMLARPEPDFQGSVLRKPSYAAAIAKTDEEKSEHSTKEDNTIEMQNISSDE